MYWNITGPSNTTKLIEKEERVLGTNKTNDDKKDIIKNEVEQQLSSFIYRNTNAKKGPQEQSDKTSLTEVALKKKEDINKKANVVDTLGTVDENDYLPNIKPEYKGISI